MIFRFFQNGKGVYNVYILKPNSVYLKKGLYCFSKPIDVGFP